MTLPPDDVREILKPVIDEVVKLVLDQIRSTNKDIKAVLLVGGFGGSQYLLQRLRETIPKNTVVLQPGYGWSAIVQGALLRGLADSNPQHAQVRLTSRVARKYIGVTCNVLFDETKHLTSRRYVSIYRIANKINTILNRLRHFMEYSGEWKTLAMSWFISKV